MPHFHLIFYIETLVGPVLFQKSFSDDTREEKWTKGL